MDYLQWMLSADFDKLSEELTVSQKKSGKELIFLKKCAENILQWKILTCTGGCSVEKATPDKGKNVLIGQDHELQTVMGVQPIKEQVFRQHVVDNQKGYASISKRNSAKPPQPKGDTFYFTADQLVKCLATVAIQIVQPQVCYTNASKHAIDKKSSLCRRVSEAAKSELDISISGNTLFDAIACILAPVLPASKIPVVIPEPFRFSASIKPSVTKLSIILNSLSPPPPPLPRLY